ncbi:MAG: hypothetical protein CMM47_01905 [Rhodospirillaceae bacterium]|nr:hypothetical protein [Rhodospirillaceae bacterium]
MVLVVVDSTFDDLPRFSLERPHFPVGNRVLFGNERAQAPVKVERSRVRCEISQDFAPVGSRQFDFRQNAGPGSEEDETILGQKYVLVQEVLILLEKTKSIDILQPLRAGERCVVPIRYRYSRNSQRTADLPAFLTDL